MVLMGASALLAGLIALAFPETVGEALPETVIEAVNIGKENPRSMFTCGKINKRKKGKTFSAVIGTEEEAGTEEVDI